MCASAPHVHAFLTSCHILASGFRFQDYFLDFQEKMVYISSIMPKRTYQPKKQKRATTHGFLVRSKSKSGAKVLKLRRQKGRKRLTVKTKQEK